jgi:hypothetical protein
VAFNKALSGTIPPEFFASALIWWRFYTFYALILLGAVSAGRTVMRALRSDEGTRATRRRDRQRGAPTTSAETLSER